MKCRKPTLSAIAVITAAAVVSPIVYVSAKIPRKSEAQTQTLGKAERTDLIRLKSPQENEEISSPLIIQGLARGYWLLKAEFPITLLDSQGNILGRCIASAQFDWIIDDFAPFPTELEFTGDALTKAVLILNKSNPSALAEHDDQLMTPAVIRRAEPLTVKVFFNNNRLDPEISCSKVFAVERLIPRTKAVARRALEELLKGPTDEEKQEDYRTEINTGVRIQRLGIENGTANVDFNEQLDFQVAGSCPVSRIWAQISQTLKQFPSVEKVIISINGRTEDILQP